MNLLDAAGKQAEAIEAGKAGMKQVPNLALALALAKRLETSGNPEEATWFVIDAAESADMSASNWELMCEAASMISADRKWSEAVDLYRKLFDVDAIPAAVRAPWLAEARRIALAGGDAGQAAQWKAEMVQAAGKPADPGR